MGLLADLLFTSPLGCMLLLLWWSDSLYFSGWLMYLLSFIGVALYFV